MNGDFARPGRIMLDQDNFPCDLMPEVRAERRAFPCGPAFRSNEIRLC